MSFASASGGSMRYTDSSDTYTFTTDGKPVVTPFGSTVTWKETGKDSWESTSTRNGSLVSTTAWKLSGRRKSNSSAHGQALFCRELALAIFGLFASEGFFSIAFPLRTSTTPS